MSSFYYRVTPEPEKADTYGFKKVSKAELTDIVSRLSKPTYNSRVQKEEPHKTHNYIYLRSTLPPRTPSSCSRIVQESQSGNDGDNRKLTERELHRLLRRIRKPTLAHLLSRNDYERNERDISYDTQKVAPRPTTANEWEKALRNLSRPTTASRGKHAIECHLCLDDDRELKRTLVPFEYPFANDKSVTKDEVDCIVSRLNSSNRAKDLDSSPCWRLSPDYGSLHVQSRHLPLVSGLSRTKSVAEIVNRLHSQKGSDRVRKFHGYSTKTTHITDYNDS